jgi:hypothetical protein
MTTTTVSDLRLQVMDVTGQKTTSVSDLQPDSTVGELIDGVLAKMRLPDVDSEGRPLVYHARLTREGRHLHSTERVGDAVQTDDSVVLLPNVEAGGRRS